MTTPDDFPRHGAPPEHPIESARPNRGVAVVATFVVGGLLVLGVMAIIAVRVLG